MRGQLDVQGHQNQGIFTWDEPVVHDGREAFLYTYHSTMLTTFETWQHFYEFIVAKETGLVLLASINRNGLPESRHERTILGKISMDFPDRFSTLKSIASAADALKKQ